jgi:hypothetical protein
MVGPRLPAGSETRRRFGALTLATRTTWPGAPRAGFTDTFEAMLTEPPAVNYYDGAFYSRGAAVSPSGPAAGRSR